MKLFTIGELITLAAVIAGNNPAHTQVIESQTFDTAISASAAGWTGFRNNLNGSLFGFSLTNHTGGISPAGEAGGTIARSADLAYYADLTLGANPNLNYLIQTSGELVVTSVGAFNNGIRIGFFDATDTSGTIDFVGFQVAEPQAPSGLLRVLPSVHLSNGGFLDGSPPELRIAVGSVYTWQSAWDPTTARMSIELFDNVGMSLGSTFRMLDATDIGIGVSLNAFGLLTGGLGQADPLNTADVFIDNVTYSLTPVSEPSGLVFCTFVAIGAFVRWRKNQLRSSARAMSRS